MHFKGDEILNRDILRFLASIIMCQTAGIVGSFFTRTSVSSWYVNLEKPFFTPPGSVFGPVWVSLYLIMGFSLFLVWRKGLDSSNAKRSFALFVIQLLINTLWSFAFFGLRSPLIGLIVIIVLLIAIIMVIIRFSSISRIASILLIPYMLWVSFAAVLNGAIFFLNR
jgi:translocator protein